MASRVRKKRPSSGPAWVRIIAGRWRSRRLKVPQGLEVRPMKDRTREALFNILAPWVPGSWAVDAFAGTGALGLEALSRGAAGATWIESHPGVLAVLRENVGQLAGEQYAQEHILFGDAFALLPKLRLPQCGWMVFFCPPYRLFEEKRRELVELIAGTGARAPQGSVLVVEAPQGFPPAELPQEFAWQVRTYPPAKVLIAGKDS